MTDVIVKLPDTAPEDGLFFETLPASFAGMTSE